jgi:hypothetical protein
MWPIDRPPQWVGRSQELATAAQACQAEAAAETEPARAAAASLRCRGLLRSDPGPLRDAVAHHRSPGPAVQLPAALEDLATVRKAGSTSSARPYATASLPSRDRWATTYVRVRSQRQPAYRSPDRPGAIGTVMR